MLGWEKGDGAEFDAGFCPPKRPVPEVAGMLANGFVVGCEADVVANMVDVESAGLLDPKRPPLLAPPNGFEGAGLENGV